MFWIILICGWALINLGIAATRKLHKNYWGEVGTGWIWSAFLDFLIALLVLAIIVSAGVCTYPNSLRLKQEVLALQSEIETVQKAHYSEVQSGGLVGGSLDNQGQSVTLSQYIQEYAKKKSEYNGKIILYQTYRKMKLCRWFWYGMFIPEKINELEEL